MNRVKRWFVGEDVSLSKPPLPPARFPEKIPYKPGTEKAIWNLPPRTPRWWHRWTHPL